MALVIVECLTLLITFVCAIRSLIDSGTHQPSVGRSNRRGEQLDDRSSCAADIFGIFHGVLQG